MRNLERLSHNTICSPVLLHSMAPLKFYTLRLPAASKDHIGLLVTILHPNAAVINERCL